MNEKVTSQGSAYVGIDVSKDRLDVAFRPATSEQRSFPNDERGIARLVTSLQGSRPELVVLESTGGLELPLVAALAIARLPVAVVNPRQVRDFAKATGKLAKTDTIDAQVLAHFAAAVRPAPRPLPDAETQVLATLVDRRRQLIAMLVAENNRLDRALPPVRQRIQAHIVWLENELRDLDKELGKALHESPVWHDKEALLRSVLVSGEF